jgi:phage terminase small subunit
MADKGLTIKQEKYAQGLFAGLTQREAYKQAYNCGNMKDATIDRNAYALSLDNKIVTRIKILTDELKERNMVTVEKVLSQLSKIAFADIKDMLSFKTVQTLDETATALVGKPIMAYKTVIDLKDSDEVDGSLIAEVKETKDGFSFKRNDQMKALELIGKHLGMFTDKVEIGNKDGKPFEVRNMSDAEIERMLAECGYIKQGKAE